MVKKEGRLNVVADKCVNGFAGVAKTLDVRGLNDLMHQLDPKSEEYDILTEELRKRSIAAAAAEKPRIGSSSGY